MCTASTPERMKMEMLLSSANTSPSRSGNANETATSAAKQAAALAAAIRRRTRQGSIRQSSTSTGIATTAATIPMTRTSGNIVHRNATVSASMIIRSMKFAVIQRTWCLNREIQITAANIASDRPAASAGRRSSASQTKLSMPQVRR